MSAIVKSVAKAPKAVAKEVKNVLKQSIKPANKHDMFQIALGSVTGGFLTPLYNKLADFVVGLIPSQNQTLVALVRAGLPFGASYGIFKLKIPFGNILAGAFLGVGIANLMSFVLGFFGKSFNLPNVFKPKASVSADPVQSTDIEGVWGVQE